MSCPSFIRLSHWGRSGNLICGWFSVVSPRQATKMLVLPSRLPAAGGGLRFWIVPAALHACEVIVDRRYGIRRSRRQNRGRLSQAPGATVLQDRVCQRRVRPSESPREAEASVPSRRRRTRRPSRPAVPTPVGVHDERDVPRPYAPEQWTNDRISPGVRRRAEDSDPPSKASHLDPPPSMSR